MSDDYRDWEWSPQQPCGGISVDGAEPPLCEVHMKRWGHRRITATPAVDTTRAAEAAERRASRERAATDQR